MESQKPVYKSKTIWGLLAAALPLLANLAGIELGNEETEQLLQVGGLILALYGRVKASGKLSLGVGQDEGGNGPLRPA